MIRLDYHRRRRRPERWPFRITAAMRGMVILVPCLLMITAFSRTTPPLVGLPAIGSAGNASGQAPLPPLSVEIHDGGVTVHEGDNLIETLPWMDDAGLDDPFAVCQEVQATQPEGRVAGATGRERHRRLPGSQITRRATPRVGPA